MQNDYTNSLLSTILVEYAVISSKFNHRTDFSGFNEHCTEFGCDGIVVCITSLMEVGQNSVTACVYVVCPFAN